MVARRLAVTILAVLVPAAALSRPVMAQVQPLFGGAPLPRVTPSKTADTVPANGALDSVTFTAQNVGGASGTFNLWITCDTITCPTASNPQPPGPVTLAAGASRTEWVKFYHPTTPVGGSVSLTMADTANINQSTGTTSIVVAQPGPAPVVDLSPFNANNQDVARCAASCFAAAYSQSTVPYFSMDAPRNVTLVYRGDRVAPQPFVQVNVTHGGTSGTLPQAFYLEVKKANGSLITFLNGETKLRFTAPSTSTYRLAGQFDATANSMGSTGVYPVTIIVGAEYSGGPSETWAASTIIVVNEANSAIARGWTVAGVQHLYVQSDGTILITDGTGTATYFTGGPTTFTSPSGEFSQLTFNGTNYIRAYADSAKVTFTSSGYMLAVADRWGTTTRIRYSGTNLYRILDPTDTTKVIQLAYGSSGLASITDPGSRVTSVSVDASGRLSPITDPDNVGTTFGYDASLRLSTVTDRRGNTTTLGYDSQAGTLASGAAPTIQVVNTDGSLTNAAPTTQYAAWQKVGVPYGSTSGTPFSSVLASQVQGSVTDPGGHATTFTVNSFGQPLVITDALGGVTTTSYSGGLPSTVAYPTGGVDSTSYNLNGTPSYSHPAGGPRTWFHYSSWAGVSDSAYGDLPAVRRYISSPGKVDSLRIGGTRLTRFGYTADGRLDTQKDSAGTVVVQRRYQGVNLNHSRDSIPGGRWTNFSQDNLGRDTAVAAPQIRTRIWHYDAVNRVVASYDSAGATPTASFFGAATLDSVKDAKGQVYRFAYNALGWLTQQTDPAGAAITSKYSRDGELRLWTNRRGQQLQYSYDALHRPLAKTGTNASAEGWSYSSNYRVLTATSLVDTETTYLGVSGQPDSTLTRMAGQAFWRRYRYSAAGLLDSVSASGGGVAFMARKYLYDPAATLSKVVLNADTTGLGRDYRGLRIMLQMRGDSAVSYANNSTAGLSQSYTGGQYSSAVVLSVAYDSLVRLARQVLGNQRMGTQYSYDALGRVAAESTVYYHGTPPTSCSGNPWPTMNDYGNSCVNDVGWYASFGTTYTYDAVGNRTDSSGAYGTGNRITAFATCTYGTDADGDVTSRACGSQNVTFWWSAESRLDSASVGGQRLAIKYDALGRLVRLDTSGVAKRYFLWDGTNLLAELGSAATTKVGEYSYYGTDRLQAMILGTTPYHAHQDVMGNTIALTDSVLRRSYGYNAWGSLTSGSDGLPFSDTDRARWKGALSFGPELGLYYMRRRWYEPKTGRFLSEDPLGLAAGINPYVYAGDDPVNGADPSGECASVYCDDAGDYASFVGGTAAAFDDLEGPWPWDVARWFWKALLDGSGPFLLLAARCVLFNSEICKPPSQYQPPDHEIHQPALQEYLGRQKKNVPPDPASWGYKDYGGSGGRSVWDALSDFLGKLENVLKLMQPPPIWSSPYLEGVII